MENDAVYSQALEAAKKEFDQVKVLHDAYATRLYDLKFTMKGLAGLLNEYLPNDYCFQLKPSMNPNPVKK